MASIVLLCTDGSDIAIDALRTALPVLAPADRTIVLTVESPVDKTYTTGNGFSSGPERSDVSDQIKTDGDEVAKRHIDATIEALGLDDAEMMAVVGDPGAAICAVAAELAASVVVLGTSGRGGFRRAMLGSTSDHVVRHAGCPVVVQGVGQH